MHSQLISACCHHNKKCFKHNQVDCPFVSEIVRDKKLHQIDNKHMQHFNKTNKNEILTRSLLFKNEQKLAQKYFNEMPENFYSIGRAGTYRYEVDIDDCISQSIEINKQINSSDYQGPIIGDHFKIKP